MNKTLILALLLCPAFFFSQEKKDKKKKTVAGPVVPDYTKTASGLQYRFITKGTAPRVEGGDKCKVHYILKVKGDSVMEDSYKTNSPWEFKASTTDAIPGFVEAVLLMGLGDKIDVIIPPALGYGEQQAGAIPPNSTLKFSIELIGHTAGLRAFNTKGKDTVKLASGLKYIQVEPGIGLMPSPGDVVVIRYSGYLPDGKMFDSSVERGETVKFNLGSSLPGFDEGIAKMLPGGKHRLIIPYQLAFGEAGRGPIPAKTDVTYDIELVEFRKKTVAVPYDVKGKDTLTTASGLKYIIVNKGMGTQGAQGKKVKVHYSGYLSDGSLFDSSVERDQLFEFTLGVNPVIPGWTEVLQIMKVGDKWRVVVSPALGYGANGFPPKIPANATLVFDMELFGVE